MRSLFHRIKYRLFYRFAPFLRLKRPVDVAIELSSICNMRCHYCYHADKNPPFKKAMMTRVTAYRIIDLCARAGVDSLKFNWRGESTVNSIYYEVAKYAREQNFTELLANTNMLYYPNRFITQALGMMDKVKVSYDSFNPAVFMQNRAGGNHARITKNIDDLYHQERNKRNPTQIVIQAVRTANNEHEDFEAEIAARWPVAKLSVRDMVGNRNNTITDGYKPMAHKRKPCIQAFSRLIFTANGDACMCCPDTTELTNLGNIWDVKRIEELFNSKKAKSIRKALKNGKAFEKEPCKSCSSYESYGGYNHPWGS